MSNDLSTVSLGRASATVEAAPPLQIDDDRGLPPAQFWAGIAVGLILIAIGTGSAFFADLERLYLLTTCIGFGIVLAAFGTRAVVRQARGGGAAIVGGAGAVTLVLLATVTWLFPEPPTSAKTKRIDLSGDLSSVAAIRIVDGQQPLYNYRSQDTDSYKFVILDGHLSAEWLRARVDFTKGSTPVRRVAGPPQRAGAFPGPAHRHQLAFRL